jgi:hypothetical protein
MSWKTLLGLGGLAFAAAYQMGPDNLVALLPSLLQ